jgi:hypothetical protein
MIKKLIALVVFIYLVPISFFLTFGIIFINNLQDSDISAIILTPILFMLVACALVIVNIASAMRSGKQSKCLPLKTVMMFKLYLIPFYVINYVCWMISSMVFHLALFVWPMIPFVVAYTYFTILGTSAHIIAKLADLRRNKIITAKQFAIHCILQLIFTLDVLDSIYLARKQEKFEKLAIEEKIPPLPERGDCRDSE